MANFPKTPQEYQEEMMRLYREAHSFNSPPVKNTAPAPVPNQNNISKPPQKNTAPIPEQQTPAMKEENNIPEAIQPMQNISPDTVQELIPIPEAILESDFISDFPPSPSQEMNYNNENFNANVNVSESALNPPRMNESEKNEAFGWLKVITRTGNEASPVENVAVAVTSRNGADTVLNYTTITDSSGETERIKLPAPPISESLGRTGDTPYSVYDVNIFLSGYYRQESRNVPIFPGVTSLQKFAMIPLPRYSNDFNKTIVYENNEPRF